MLNNLQLCVKNVFKTVLSNTLPRNDRQMKALGVGFVGCLVLGGFLIVKHGKKRKN